LKQRPRTVEEPRPLLTPELADFLYQKGEILISRIHDRYLPGRHGGFVGDDADSLPPRLHTVDPHRVLGLKTTATEADVKRRVRELAKVYHPDLLNGDADKMTEVNDAARKILRNLGPKPKSK